MDDLNLIPDPGDKNVWENMRRIMEWAAAIQPVVSDSDRFLLMGS